MTDDAYKVPRDLVERALHNAEASVDFEERYLFDLHDQIERHTKRLATYRRDVIRLRESLTEEHA